MIDLKTISETRKAIRECSEVLMQPQFGCSERWVKVRKSDAMDLLKGYSSKETPAEAQMHTDVFGQLDDGVLYLG